MVTVTFTVRFYETDMMGVVHHTNHLRYFELGRVEYLRRAGIDLNELMAEHILFPIKKVACEYIEPATFDDVLRLETTMEKVSRAQMTFTYRIIREKDNTLLATGMTQNVFTDMRTGQIIRIGQAHVDRMKKFMEAQHNEA